jgi:molybdopterin molybdotransferase
VNTLTPLPEALRDILAASPAPPPTETCPLLDARGRVLAASITSPIAVPAEDNSAMDGYALRAADAAVALPVTQRIAAGSCGDPLEPGTAARIFTGAPLPPGADAVAMQEDCELRDGVVNIRTELRPGENVRPRGQDLASGAEVLPVGRRLRPQDLGLLASVGRTTVDVYRRLRVAVLSTGDELIEPGSGDLNPGQLYNSNRYTLAASIAALGMEVVDGGIVPDDPEATREALQRAAARADVIITSGGVSVGEEDHVKAQVEELGELALWKLAIKPGKPLAFGRVGESPILGLPGNPTSVYVTFNLVARPFLLKMQGATELTPPVLRARAGFSVSRPGGRRDHLRVSLEQTPDGLVARRFGNQSSGVLSSVSYSQALAVVPIGATLAEGDPVDILLLDLF